MTKAVSYIDSKRMVKALTAAISRLFQRREYIDRINVFPVPDGDTGTNMAFSFKVIHDAVRDAGELPIKQLMTHVADASLDGARGNSGAIMAQYFHGFSEALDDSETMTAAQLATASSAGARAAWTAMSEPVAGTLPTVLEDFSMALEGNPVKVLKISASCLNTACSSARESLARTPDLLPVLKQAGVVDAGGQGFVDLMEGIWSFVENGETDSWHAEIEDMFSLSGTAMEMDAEAHRFCTECVIEGDDLDRAGIMKHLRKLDCSSLVVAGGRKRVRVHIHVNNPGEAYLACEHSVNFINKKPMT